MKKKTVYEEAIAEAKKAVAAYQSRVSPRSTNDELHHLADLWIRFAAVVEPPGRTDSLAVALEMDQIRERYR